MKYKKPKGTPQHNFGRKVCRGAFWSCWHCGLIRLNNEATQRAINKGCVDDQEPMSGIGPHVP